MPRRSDYCLNKSELIKKDPPQTKQNKKQTMNQFTILFELNAFDETQDCASTEPPIAELALYNFPLFPKAKIHMKIFEDVEDIEIYNMKEFQIIPTEGVSEVLR